MGDGKKTKAAAKSSRAAKKGTPADDPPPAPAVAVAPSRAPNRKSFNDVHISPDTRVSLYGLARSLPKEFKKESGLLLPFVTYFQDPFVATLDPHKAFDEEVLVAWEPGFSDGPTSSRFAIVDYNADTGRLETPAVWDEESQAFVGLAGAPLDTSAASTFQFHQVSVWALLQCSLAFFEDASALGRTIPWAFEGNRLIVVPHAGYGENAYYDRASKSLQLYYFGSEQDTVYTCLSTDIVHHEFGHAVLDGIRPLFNESSHPQTAAFHEFMGDLTAILLTLKNRTLRHQLAESSGGKFKEATTLSSIAEEFGQAVEGRPYLRTACNDSKMSGMVNDMESHRLSEVLTGAMFDALIALGERYQDEDDAAEEPKKKKSPIQVFWLGADRMQRTAIQPLDLLPPVEVTFRDYALAVCRSQQLSDPLDPDDYYGMLIKVFRDREILSADDEAVLREPRYLYDRLDLSVHHSLDDISRSRAAAYRFLDDNREDLLIPASRDFFVADLYDVKKRGRQNLPLPRQIVLLYAWRQEVLLDGPRFGRFAGRTTTMLCGGTLVFNENGNVLSWMRKPGSEPYGGKRTRRGKMAEEWEKAVHEGAARKAALLDLLAAQIAAGRIGTLLGSPNGLMASMMPPMIAEGDGEMVRFQLSPHLHLSGDDHAATASETGERQWEISC
ncbi:MAG TPA: serine protease [Thermoanaerobaculia bacterium]|jgi:hypothetical protein|nr:serine protease [Thermoanaerobaculia bacterium]